MECIFEFILELILELCGEGIQSERLPKFLRYLLLALITVPLLALFIFAAVSAGEVVVSVIFAVLAAALLAGIVFLIYRINKYGIFKQAVKEDLPAVLKLYRSVIGHPGCTWNVFYPNEANLHEDFSTGNLYILKKGNDLAGAASVVAKNELDDLECWVFRENAGEIARVVIDPKYQGKGYGKHIVTLLCHRLEKKGFEAVHLLVSVENHHALNLYREAGFKNKGQCQRYDRAFYAFEKKL